MLRYPLLWITLAVTGAGVGEAVADGKKGWPADMEQKLWSHFAEHAQLEFTSIPVVSCGATLCEIRLTGPDIHADQSVYREFIDEFVLKLLAQSVPVRQYATSRAEVSPGVQGYIVMLSNEWAPSGPTTGSPRPRSVVAGKAQAETAGSSETQSKDTQVPRDKQPR
jgi:hypothetical protein